MNRCVGKKCPFCKSLLQVSEEIVICSACEMPHHKECWVANQGCTTFACLGTIRFPEAAQPRLGYFISAEPAEEPFIAEKTEHYLPIFHRLRASHTFLSWNWASFLLAPFWLLYRKMYRHGAAVLSVLCVITLIANVWLSLLLVAGNAVLAMFANLLYLLQIEKLAADAAKLPPAHREDFIARKGGTDIAVATIGAAIYLLFVLISLLV